MSLKYEITKEEADHIYESVVHANDGKHVAQTCMGNQAANSFALRFSYRMLLAFHEKMSELEAEMGRVQKLPDSPTP